MTSLDGIAVKVESATGNVEPLLHEIRHALKRVADGKEGTVIDLRSLPLAPGEEERIEAFLGEGEVRAELDTFGATVFQETSYAGVWLVTHRNMEQAVLTRFIEVTRTPELLKSQRADIEHGISRLEDALAVGGKAEASQSRRKSVGVQEIKDSG